MSKENVLNFLRACNNDPALLKKFEQKNLPEVILHAKSLGYDFSSEELAAISGAMEAEIIIERMGEEINAYSSLWLKMWGKPRLQYVVEELFRVFLRRN